VKNGLLHAATIDMGNIIEGIILEVA